MENWNKFLNEAQDAKPKLIFLIGPPAVGKSTWITANPNIVGDHVILNRDELVEKVAAESNIGTYDAMYVRPKISAPKGMPSREQLEQYSSNPEIKKIVDTYIESLRIPVADYNTKNPEMVAQYGAIEGFDAETLIKIATVYGVPTQYITPFFFPSIEEANERVANELQKAREDAVGQKKNIVVDMTSMSGGERNLHRKQIAGVITKNPEIDDKAALEQINEDFIQEAYVFAPNAATYEEIKANIKPLSELRDALDKAQKQKNEELYYTLENQIRELVKKQPLLDYYFKIQKIGQQRAGEIAGELMDPKDPDSPKRSKTIPPRAYDGMFAKYEPPSSGEGYSQIMYVGVPSLAGLKGN
jgi:hypothetical protein